MALGERFLILGATGDLTGRYLLPALAELAAADCLPEDLSIVAVAREPWDSRRFRRHASDRLARFAGHVSEATRCKFVEGLRYHFGDVAHPAALVPAVADATGPVVAYLALPPAVFGPAIEALAAAGIGQGSRLVVEKPFGSSREFSWPLTEILADAPPRSSEGCGGNISDSSCIVVGEMQRDTTSGSMWSEVAGGLTQLFERERVPMLRLATLLVGSVHVAEEVVQDAFESIDSRWAELDRPGAYLRTVVVNGCRAVLRRRDVEDRYRRAVAVVQNVDHIPTRLIEVREALHRLTERQHIVIVLRYFVDLSDGSIAELLECRPSTVRSLARRALMTLRKELE